MTSYFPQGSTNKYVVVVIFAAMLSVLIVLGLYGAPMHSDGKEIVSYKSRAPDCPPQVVMMNSGTSSTQKDSEFFIQQRNKLSYLLNQQKKQYGQQSCKMADLKKVKGVSANGGWCAKQSSPGSKQHLMDQSFAKAISKFLQGKHVGSFGDGPGAYKKFLTSLGELASYTAYDGAPFCEDTTLGQVSFLDLTGPQYGLPAFDWVTSVEVGEHIPKEFEDVYLDNLVRHAKEGIILSWAVPDSYAQDLSNMVVVDAERMPLMCQ